jgi:hypothetical protein
VSSRSAQAHAVNGPWRPCAAQAGLGVLKETLNKPNELCSTVIQLQRFCGQPFRLQRNRCRRRGRSNRGDRAGKPHQKCEPGVAQPSCVPRRVKLPAVFPSLRAHEPLSCRARDPPGPGPLLRPTNLEERLDYFHLSHPAVRTVPYTQECKLSKLSPEPKGPEYSVYKPAHADIHRHAKRQERKQHRRSAVTH